MIYLWAAGLTILNLLWLALNVLGLPGNWLMIVSAALVAWAAGGAMFSVWTLVAVVAMAGLGELLELGLSLAATRTAGGTRRSAWGALAGGLVGGIVGLLAIPIPLIGPLIGACVGAAVGAIALDLSAGRSLRRASGSGVAAGVGRLLGTVTKLLLGVVIWLVLAIAAFWP
jgi:uncharacterized protein YqgC (DUF456 family)